MTTLPEEFRPHTRSWKLSMLNLGPLGSGHVSVDVFARRRAATVDGMRGI